MSSRKPSPVVAKSPGAVLVPLPLPSPAMTARRCDNCKHWSHAKKEGSDYGTCKRYPPTVLDSSRITSEGPFGLYILTRETDLCGEHSPR